METIFRNVADLDRGDRSVLERIVGRSLSKGERLIIQVIATEQPSEQPAGTPSELPEWCDLYAGLSEAEIDDLDAAIRQRANLSRPGPA
jgi:hypothetical protein